MKNLFSVFTYMICAGVLFIGFTFETSVKNNYNFSLNSPLDLSKINNKSDAKGESDKPESSDWYKEALSNIQKAEYNVSFSESLNAYQSPNRANNMRFVYNNNGFSAMLRNNKVAMFDESNKMIEESEKKYEYLDDWNIDFRLESILKELNSTNENGYTDFSGNELSACGNKISIENDNLRIQYKNDENGMRQDFIVKNKPEGEGQLRLNINADTELKMIAGADALMFKDCKGDLKLKYASLKVWDANGRELRAYFEKSNYELRITNYELKDRFKIKTNSKSEFPNSKLFSIVVNDEDAVYPITIDPLSSVPNWTAEINQASAKFGLSVATAGDVNGDGYSEVIVGAPNFDNGQTDEGGVFIYHGSITGLSLTPNWTKEGNQVSANFGFSVATAGDVNGDGYSDVIIGAPTYDSVQTDEGRAFVYNGSASGLQSGYSWKYETNHSTAYFGYSVACVGDMNNDGYSDIVVGSPFYDGGQTNEGEVHMFKGSSAGITSGIGWNIDINQTEANFGFSVASAGDVNGDGFSDMLISSYKYDGSFTNEGRVFLFHSTGTSYPATANSIRIGTQTGEFFGYSVSTAGDVNGDGYSDVIIGAPLFDGGQTDEGKCYAYLGSSSGIGAAAIWTKESNEAGGQFGISVSTAGDMNADGFADVILGGDLLENIETNEGRAFVYLGYSGGLNNGTAIIYESNQISSEFGFSVATAGDINGDGFSDVIVGAHEFDNPSTGEGAAFVYLGSATGMGITPGWTADGNQENANFGNSVSSAGDVNGDGYSDVIIGAPNFDNGELNEGATFVYHGSALGLSTFSNWSAEGNQADASFGTSVSSAGDVNGDGYSDVIVGAYLYDNGQSGEGAAFVYHGSSSGLSATSNWSAEGNQLFAYFGISVSSAGDVNGDGYSDVIIGSIRFSNGQAEEGAAFVYHGSATGLSALSNWSAEGNQSNAGFGISVSSAGDVNGDGYSDVMVGAFALDNGQTNEGAAYVYHGSPLGLTLTSIWNAESNQANSNFGESVSTAGDVNGDGYTDVIVGSTFFDNGQTDEGRAFVYYGSASGLSLTSNWTAESNQSGASFGISVATAGDVNGDGYSDIIVGAYNFSDIILGQGAAFVYLGSASGLSLTSNWDAESENSISFFGYSVFTAGDVNGDGYSDVLVGAKGEGSAFVYYGGSNGGLKSTVNQFKLGSSQIVSSTGNTGENGKVRLQHFAKSPFGRGSGRIVYETKPNGSPFSGSVISNSTSYNSSPPAYTNLGLTGTNISQDITGFNPSNQYKWRARTQYKLTSFPFQKYGPWRYYSNYIPNPSGGFRPKPNDLILNLTMFIEGFYNAGTDNMVGDSVSVYLRNSSAPYAIENSSKAFVSSAGIGTFKFLNAVNGVNYYLHLKHRNSIETWSKTTQMFTSDILNYNFISALAQAYGNNQKLVDSSPVRYGIFSGDVNQDGSIDLTDVIQTYNASNIFTSGYAVTDINGDSIVDLNDILIAYNNSAGFVAVVRP